MWDLARATPRGVINHSQAGRSHGRNKRKSQRAYLPLQISEEDRGKQIAEQRGLHEVFVTFVCNIFSGEVCEN